jgi:two-component system phosphate regulon sensor histidine kinase PhoR
MEPHNTQDRPEVIAALSGLHGRSVRTSKTLNVVYRYFAEPVWHDGEVVAVVRVAFPVSDSMGIQRRVLSDVLYGFVSLLFIAVVLSVLLGWIWRRPLARINRIARNISHGDLSDIPPVSGPLEMNELATNIDRMRKMVVSQLATITQQQERFRIILHHLPDAVFALNHADEVLYCNESAKKLFRIDSMNRTQHLQQLIRQVNILDFYFRESKRLRIASADVTMERLELEWQGQKRVLDLELLSVPGTAGADEITVLLVISDVTVQLRTSQMKVDFVANASHELRTPLATIRAALDNINDGVYDDAESLHTVLQILNRHVARLEALIEDLLSLHSVDDQSTLLRRERTTAEEQQRWLNELFSEKAVERDVFLSFDPGENLPPFMTDNKRLGLILQNLVDNAIKFTPVCGKVNVRFTREGDSQLVIICTDTGCGIAPHEQDRVFERFYQVNASRTGDSRVRGTGLGLAIVKHAVERLNGTVTLNSRLGYGTTMTVRIPVEFQE